MIPSEGEALAIHRKYGSKSIIIEHCKTVERVAVVVAKEFDREGVSVDVKAVAAGALLHDLGRTRVQTVWHGFEGAEMLVCEGVESKVVEIVRRHVGAGLAPEEAKKLGLPDFDFIPKTLEERIVCFADKMVDGDRVRPFEEEVRRFKVKSHDVGRLLALKKGLQDELGEDPEKVVFEKLKATG